jgi:hypothetical protein
MVGVAAFVFSAVSPGDDDIQQKFGQQRFRYSRITRIGKARPTHVASNSKIACAVLLVPSVSLHQEWKTSVVVDLSASVPILATASGERSPPLS